MNPYYLLTFDKDNLAAALADAYPRSEEDNRLQPRPLTPYTTVEEVMDKDHFDYLYRYLTSRHLDAKMIVIEQGYISKDYLVDYASYYASCFDDYSKKCNRLHFFSTYVDAVAFQKILLEEQTVHKEFWSSYLGYIVAKPIPQKVIGKTVLIPYPFKDDNSVRVYFGTRKYKVNVFGNKLELYSLGFMEQDGVVSVCATAAIWMMLQKASDNSYAVLKTPSEITDEADIVGVHGERLFPNKGLTIKQISKAIFRSGLVSEIRTPKKAEDQKRLDTFYLKRIVNAYALIGIPIILIIRVPYLTYDENGEKIVDHADHAITILGYKDKMGKALKEPSEGIQYRADSMEMLFAHDDRWGPFAKVEFPENDVLGLITSWSKNPKLGEGDHKTMLMDIIIPVYHKIRISYDDVALIVTGANAIFINKILKGELQNSLNWDINLVYSEVYKTAAKKYHPLLAKKIILQQMPKYIWVARCYEGNEPVCEIIFDATDVNTGMFAFHMYFFNEKRQIRIHNYFHHDAKEFEIYFRHDSSRQFCEFIREKSKILLDGSYVNINPKKSPV
jgi:hypothetical protein